MEGKIDNFSLLGGSHSREFLSLFARIRFENLHLKNGTHRKENITARKKSWCEMSNAEENLKFSGWEFARTSRAHHTNFISNIQHIYKKGEHVEEEVEGGRWKKFVTFSRFFFLCWVFDTFDMLPHTTRPRKSLKISLRLIFHTPLLTAKRVRDGANSESKM